MNMLIKIRSWATSGSGFYNFLDEEAFIKIINLVNYPGRIFSELEIRIGISKGQFFNV